MKENWQYKKLGEVCEIKSGYTPATEDVLETGEIPYFKVGDMNSEGNEKFLINTLSYLSYPCKTFPKDSIVFPKNGAAIGTNKKRILKQPSVVDLNTAILVPNNDYNIEFLYYYILNIDFKKITRRGAVPTLDIKELKSFILPYLSLSEQERIVAELDLLSGIIEKQKQQLNELDTLALSIFYSLFGDPISNDKKWVIKSIGDVGEIVGGSTPSTHDESNWDGDINWVTPAELNNQLFYGETQRKITQKAANKLTLMPIGTILLSSRAPIGKLAITTVPMCCNQGFKNIICGEKINNVFMFYLLSLTIEYIKALGRGATFKEVSKQSISNHKIIIPPISLQNQFAKKIEKIEKQKEAINKSIEETQKLFDYTMDKYFG